MERTNIIRTGLALIAMVSIVLAMAAPAMADHYAGSGDRSYMDKGKYDRMDGMRKAHKDIYMTIAVDGMTGETATFSVMNMAMGKDDKGILIKPGAPLTGTYNTSNDMGYISTANFMPVTMVIDTANETAIPVAGASAIMGMHDMKVLSKEKDYKVFQFGKVSFMTPDGNTMTYKLDKPVRVTYSEDRNMVVIDAYPTFTRRMAEAIGTGATFPADAEPVPLSSLKTTKPGDKAEQVSYEKPAYVAPPT